MSKKTPLFKPCANRFSGAAAIVLLSLGLFSGLAMAQTWDEIGSNNQTMLRPLRGTWEQIPPQQRQQWLQHVPSLQKMNSAERDTAQERMAEWASLSSRQRVQVEQRLRNDANDNANTRSESWTRYLNFR